MKFDLIKKAVTSKAARHIFLAKKNSPTIFFVAGTVGIVGTVALACRATLKVSDAMDAYETRLEEIKEKRPSAYSEHEDVVRDIQKLKRKTAVEIVKPYLPAVGLGVLSIGALTGSHVILTKRNGTLIAAYAALDRGFKEYRDRVADEYGKDVDKKFATGASTYLTEEKMADGTTKTGSKTEVDGRFGGSPYAIVFDELSRKFSKEPGRNAQTIMMIQSYANDKLKAQGHLFLNEVLDMLGLPRTPAGSQVGWFISKDPEYKGDGYVDFGVWTGEGSLVESFIEGKEYYVTLDFNVDGVIWNLI